MRNPGEFERIMSDIKPNAEKLHLNPPKSARPVRPPRRMEQTENPVDAAILDGTENMRKH